MNATCPNCGKPVPPSALEGLCPECMLRVGAAAHTEAPGESGPHGNRVVPPPPLNPEDIAKHFPQLEILECLGRGGMGVVYKARQPRLDRLVALKILAPEKEQQPKFAERFAREAKALARLNHPNIVTVHDFGEADGFYYLLMEFVDGMTLRQLLQGQKLAPEEALIIVPKICEALQFAHEQGVVHRDIKPENVLLDKQGRVKIADFGIAKIVSAAGGAGSPLPAEANKTEGGAHGVTRPTISLTQDQVVGTPHYMAPEQVERPQFVDHRADIYSLGVVFYEMLTGELPLGKFQPPSKKVQVDVRLDEVVLHALEKEPERRYQHASEVKTALETIAGTAGAQAQPAANPVRMDSNSVASRATAIARQQVQAPAVAILITVGLNYLLLVSLSASLATGVPRLPFALVAGAITALVVVGAVQMWRGKTYALAVVASVLVMIIPPACIVGLPLGVWALLVLSRREVRELFGKLYPLSPPESPQPSRGGGAWKVAAVAVAAVLLVLAIPVAALLLKIGIPSVHKTGKRAQAIAAAQNAPPATALAVGFGPVVERVLDSAATQRPIKAEPGTFKLTLTNGVSVEVVAVTRNPLANELWWKPDGTPLPQPPGARVIFQPTGMWKERDVDEEARAVLVRCGLPAGAAPAHWSYGLEFAPRAERLGMLQIQQGNRMEQVTEELERLGRKIVGGAGGPKLSSQIVGYAEVVRFPAGTKEVALQCRSAVGPWEPVAVFDGKQTKVVIEGVRVLCTHLRQEPSGKCLDVTHDVDRGLYALRTVGVFKGGRREELVFHSGVLSGRETQGFVVLEPGQRVENIVEFVLERTPWVNGRIEGITLEPKAPSAMME